MTGEETSRTLFLLKFPFHFWKTAQTCTFDYADDGADGGDDGAFIRDPPRTCTFDCQGWFAAFARSCPA